MLTRTYIKESKTKMTLALSDDLEAQSLKQTEMLTWSL